MQLHFLPGTWRVRWGAFLWLHLSGLGWCKEGIIDEWCQTMYSNRVSSIWWSKLSDVLIIMCLAVYNKWMGNLNVHIDWLNKYPVILTSCTITCCSLQKLQNTNSKFKFTKWWQFATWRFITDVTHFVPDQLKKKMFWAITFWLLNYTDWILSRKT